jgi:pantoate--beta-alanine ligase
VKLFKEINAFRKFLKDKRLGGVQNIGFVPTMGALHSGHISLINASKQNNQLTICSIFVNPTQFNNTDDLAKYPRTIENDIKLLIENNCDVLFYPEVSEMYIDDEKTNIENYGFITDTLEGHFRPGHFNGVIAIVKKLFDVVESTNAYFGQKDYQQCAVVNQLIIKNNLSVRLNICPTLRETDGLAMSSRNARLTIEEREAAAIIFQTLFQLKKNFNFYSIDELKARSFIELHSSPLIKIEYLEIVNPTTLKPLEVKDENTKAVALIAVWCGNVRLIDNMLLFD